LLIVYIFVEITNKNHMTMNNLYLIFFVFIYQSVFSQIDNKAFQLEFLKVLNDYRIENGLNPVKVNVDVQSAAKIQSDYIVSTFYNYKDSSLRGNTGHYNPNYPNPNDRLESINFNLAESSNVSENVFYFTGGSLNSKSIAEYVKLTFESWKKSPSHNKNLLNPNITSVGLFLSTKQVKVNVVTYDVYNSTLVMIEDNGL